MIRDWVQSNIKEGRLQSGGREWVCNSVVDTSDYKRHMSVNLETGLWQCFKSGETGNFYQLVSIIRGVPYHRGKEIFYSYCIENGQLPEQEEAKIVLPEIKSLENEEFKQIEENSAADIYVRGRMLNPARFYYADSGRYAGRLIIPFEDEHGLFYFTARALGDRTPKYLNPPSEAGVKSSHVLLPYDTESTDPLFITEGAFDAIALKESGLNATCTNGCSPSLIQMRYLRDYRGPIVVAYDNDDAGREGLERFERLRKRCCMPTFNHVFPPDGYKDWNELLMEGEQITAACASEYKPYDWANMVLSGL